MSNTLISGATNAGYFRPASNVTSSDKPVTAGVSATPDSHFDCEAARQEAPNLFNVSPLARRAFATALGAEAGAVVGITAGVVVAGAALVALPALPFVAVVAGVAVAGAAIGAAVGWFGSKDVADCG